MKFLSLFYNDRIWCNHGRRCSDRNSTSMQGDPIINCKGSLPESESPSVWRIKCPTSPSTSHNLWRCPWPVLGPARAIQQGWGHSQRTLHLPRRLRGSRIQFSLNSPPSLPLQSKISLDDCALKGESLITQYNLCLWLLWWDLQKIWQSQRLVLFQWHFWLSPTSRDCRRRSLLRTWRTLTQKNNSRYHQNLVKKPRNPSFWPTLRPYVVRPIIRCIDLASEFKRCRLAVRPQSCWVIFARKWGQSYCTRSSARTRRI